MRRAALFARTLWALPLLTLSAPVAAQEHDHSAHQAQPVPAPAPTPAPTATTKGHDHADHAAMGHGAMDHSEMDHSQMEHSAIGHTMAPPAANVPPPARADEGPVHAADAIWGSAAMARARGIMADEMGGDMVTGVLHVDRLEARLGAEDGYAWEIEGKLGTAVDGFVLKSEGEGEFGGDLEQVDVQALWGQAITPWFDLQAGAKLDIEPETRAHAALGLAGLLPYNIHFETTAFLSDKGDLTAAVEAEHDMRLTQRLILQPRVEAQFAAQDIPHLSVASGLTALEAGLRLRYEITRQFAPYVGVEHEQLVGGTRRIARNAGDDPSQTVLLLGLKTWF